MYVNLKVIAALLVLSCAPLQLYATAQDQLAIPRDSSGEPLTAKEVRQMEKTAINAADHRQLAAYYEFQAQQADKKLADAQELERKWGPMERATKTPDPYPHARRLVNEYTAQGQKYSRLAEDHEWMAEKYDIAARALKNGGNTNDGSASESIVNQNTKNETSGGQRNTFTLGPKR
jgi:hypothetical protein